MQQRKDRRLSPGEREQLRQHRKPYIEELNSRSLTDFVPLTKSKGSLYNCPICGSGTGPNKTGALSIHGGRVRCFAGECFSEKGEDILGALCRLEGATENEVLSRYTAYRPEDALAALQGAPEPEESVPDYASYFQEAMASLFAHPEALAYLAGRGIGPETAARFQLGYDSAWRSPTALAAGKQPPASRRLIVPTGPGSYLARAIDPETEARFKAMKQGRVELFNLAALPTADRLWVVEGEFDALSVAEAGGEAIALGSVSNVGKLLSACEVERPAGTLLLSLDRDEAGQKAQQRLTEGLAELGISCFAGDLCGDYKDPNEHLQRDRASFLRAVGSDPEEDARQEALVAYEKSCLYHEIEGFITGIHTHTPPVPTGWQAMDMALEGGLYEGLYILGAISSLGKTTFVLQMADQMAQQGQDVLIFSLEMSKHELMAKSISRLTVELCGGNRRLAKTQLGITDHRRHAHYSDEERRLINDCLNSYAAYARRLYVNEGLGTITVDHVREVIGQHARLKGKPPVVIIDYLQALATVDIRGDQRAAVDRNVFELKRISRDYKIPVLAISSLNRENYKNQISMTAFKESGLIEYTSDVLLGLQFQGMNERPDAQVREADLNDWKARGIRDIELVVLKNRKGRTGVRVSFAYEAAFNHFQEGKERRQAETPVRERI